MYKNLKERITETTQYYLLRNVHPRAEQPFQVRDDDEMQELVESIRMNGVLNPLIVTPRRGGYEIVSGHRRYAACQKLGVETVPVIVRDLDPDEKQKNSAERSAITQKMTNVRREMNLADDILSDSIRLVKAIAAEKACEERLVPDRTKQKHKEQER